MPELSDKKRNVQSKTKTMQITAAQFKAAVELDPAWASKLTEPVKITDFCNMDGSKITHLSSLLHFTAKNENGESASFWGCKSLKVAEGRFEGYVRFDNSGIEKIGDLSCGKDNWEDSSSFFGCKSLKIAEGKFEGHVDFHYSGIETIGDLSCRKNDDGIRLNITSCPNLQSVPLTFNPKEIEAEPELIEKLEVDRFIQKKREEIVEIEL